MKKVNQTQVLDLIRTSGPLSKTELAERTQLTFAAVSKIVKELEETGIIVPKGEGKSSGGRKPILYQLNPDAFVVVAVDLSVEDVKVALLDVHTRILGNMRVPAPLNREPSDYVDTIASCLHHLLKKTGVEKDKILGVGVSSPGPVHAETGEVFDPPNLPKWGMVPLKRLLEESLDLVVKVEKDGNVSALGERWLGAGKNVDNFIYVLVGEGIGGGILINGALYRGSPFGAGEIGHNTVDLNGPRCNCGNFGCLEVMASGLAVVRMIQSELDQGLSSYYDGKMAPISFPEVLKALQEGDELTQQAFRKAAQILGVGITGLLNSFRPERVIIGGKVPRAYPEMIDIAAQTARERVISVFRDNVCVVPEQLGEQSALIGAAALVLEELFTLQWMK